jgi:hypothetical protein
LGQHDNAAVAHQRQRGQRSQWQSLDAAAAALGAQAQMLRGEQDVVSAQRLAGRLAQLVQQRGRVGCDMVQPRDQGQRLQGRRRGSRLFVRRQ